MPSAFLSSVKCNITELESENAFILEVRAKTFGQTGVEMEALMGVNIGLLTIYDMVKAIDKTMVLSEICLLEKWWQKWAFCAIKTNRILCEFL